MEEAIRDSQRMPRITKEELYDRIVGYNTELLTEHLNESLEAVEKLSKEKFIARSNLECPYCVYFAKNCYLCPGQYVTNEYSGELFPDRICSLLLELVRKLPKSSSKLSAKTLGWLIKEDKVLMSAKQFAIDNIEQWREWALQQLDLGG